MKFCKQLLIFIMILYVAIFTSCQFNINDYENSSEPLPYDNKSDVVESLAGQVAKGMTYNEVCLLLGNEGIDIGYGDILYKWDIGNGQKLLVWFSKPQGVENVILPDELIVIESIIE